MFLPSIANPSCTGRSSFGTSDSILLYWAAFLSIRLLASVLTGSSSLIFIFLRPYFSHKGMPGSSRAFVHGCTFNLFASMEIALIVGLLHWSSVPIQSYSCSLCIFLIFYMTKDAYLV